MAFSTIGDFCHTDIGVKGADCCSFGHFNISAAELAQTCFTLDQQPLDALLRTLAGAALASQASSKKAA